MSTCCDLPYNNLQYSKSPDSGKSCTKPLRILHVAWSNLLVMVAIFLTVTRLSVNDLGFLHTVDLSLSPHVYSYTEGS